MPSLYSKRGDGSASRLIREIFRKKRDEDDVPSLRELLQSDRGDLLRDIERILQGHKSSDNLPRFVPVTVRYCSTASQTELPEEAPQPSLARDGVAKVSKYTSSSTQTEQHEDEASELTLSASTASLLQASSNTVSADSTLEADSDFRSSVAAKIVEDTVTTEDQGVDGQDSARDHDTPEDGYTAEDEDAFVEEHIAKRARTSGPIRCAMGSPYLAAISRQYAPVKLASQRPAVTRRQSHSIDDETGAITIWNMSKIAWRGKHLIVRLPPQTFSGNLFRNVATRPRLVPVPSNTVAGDIDEMRKILQTLQNAGTWVAIDDEVNGVDGTGREAKSHLLPKPTTFSHESYVGAVFRF